MQRKEKYWFTNLSEALGSRNLFSSIQSFTWAPDWNGRNHLLLLRGPGAWNSHKAGLAWSQEATQPHTLSGVLPELRRPYKEQVGPSGEEGEVRGGWELVSASGSKLARCYICHHGGNSISQITCCCIKDLHQKGQRWSENGILSRTLTRQLMLQCGWRVWLD